MGPEPVLSLNVVTSGRPLPVVTADI